MNLFEWYITLLYFLNHFFCHQLPERSIYINGLKLPVCSRCTGIYLGLFTGYLMFPMLYKVNNSGRIGILNYFIPIIPIAIDGLTQLFKLRECNNLIRFITGSLFGISVAFIIIYLILYLLDETDINIYLYSWSEIKYILKYLLIAFLIDVSIISISLLVQNIYTFLILSTFITIYALIHNIVMPILLLYLVIRYFIGEIYDYSWNRSRRKH